MFIVLLSPVPPVASLSETPSRVHALDILSIEGKNSPLSLHRLLQSIFRIAGWFTIVRRRNERQQPKKKYS